jgi:Mg-chelatase subunit ChlI
MSVNVRTLLDVGQRTQLVLDRLAFEQDQEAFIESVQPEQEALTAKLVAARELLPK